jgi:hypothetical protein
MATLAFADNYPTRSKEDRPELKQAIDRLNAEVKAWNARCLVTNSAADQESCEQERLALEARKFSIRKGDVPSDYTTNAKACPTVDVTLRYSTRGKIVKRVETDSTGHFNLGTFPASTYIMEFRARKAARIQDQRFAIQVDGIKAVGRQSGILAKYLIGGFGVDVETSPGTPVKGQVTTGSLAPAKKMVWIPRTVGSNFNGYWAEEGSSRAIAGAGSAHIPLATIRKMQDHGDQ